MEWIQRGSRGGGSEDPPKASEMVSDGPLLHPWLVPSSGVAGIADLSSSFILPCLLHCPFSTLPRAVISLLHASFHLRFGCHHLLSPGMSTSSILLTMCFSFILLTWPCHFSCFSVVFSEACASLVVPLMCSFQILSLLVTPHIHLSILISFTSSRASCPLVVARAIIMLERFNCEERMFERNGS